MAEATTRLNHSRQTLGPAQLSGLRAKPGVSILHTATAVANGSQGCFVPDEPTGLEQCCRVSVGLGGGDGYHNHPWGGGPVGVLHSCHGWLLLCLGQCFPVTHCAACQATRYVVTEMIQTVMIAIPTMMLAKCDEICKCRAGQRSISA